MDKSPRKPGLSFVNQLRDYGLPNDAPQEARDLVNLAVDRVADVICERVSAAIAPSVLKGSAMVLELLAVRVARGEHSLAEAVAEASRRIHESETRALSPPSKPKDAVDAEFRPALPTTTPDGPPSPTSEKGGPQHREMPPESQEQPGTPGEAGVAASGRSLVMMTEEERGWNEPPIGWNRF